MSVEEERHLSKYLSVYYNKKEGLERLIRRIFKARYPDLQAGAPAGGGDLGIDILHCAPGGVGTVWCITVEKEPGSKLREDAEKVIASFSQWKLKKLEKIYLCTSRRLSNGAFVKIRKKVIEEVERLTKKGVTYFTNLDINKYDCESIASDLTTENDLRSDKEEIQREMRKNLAIPEIPAQNLVRLGKTVPRGEDDIGENIDDIPDEGEEDIRAWSTLYKQIRDSLVGIEKIKNEARILAAVDDITRLVGATRSIGFDYMALQFPSIRRKLNERLWAEMLSSYAIDPLMSKFDVRLAAVALYFNLMVAQRAFSLSLDDVENANCFVFGNAVKGRLARHPIVYRLVALLLWLNHRLCRFDNVLKLVDIAYKFLLSSGTHSVSNEERILLLNLASLYIHAVKYGDGDTRYRGMLATSFNSTLEILEYGFWRQSLTLMALLYDRRTTSLWSTTREQFLQGFEEIELHQVNTLRKAMTYLELHAKYLELTGVTGLEAFEKKLNLLTQLKEQIGDNFRLRLHRLFLEIGICYFCPWHELPNHFLYLEDSLRNISGSLGNVWGPIVKLRILSLFLFRILDRRVLDQEKFLHRSSILSLLLAEGERKSLKVYFGIPEFRMKPVPRGEGDVYQSLKKRVIRPLISHGLSYYANVILPNQSLPPGILARATLDYMDFLTKANALYPDLQVSIVFGDLIRFLEDKANETIFLHYYLGRLYYKHYMRNIPKALQHFDQFWLSCSDLEKNVFAGDYIRALYEHYIYFERDKGEQASLEKLLQVGGDFLKTGSKRHFISCYYGLAIILKNPDNGQSRDVRFLHDLARLISELGQKHMTGERNYYENLIGATVYTSRFHKFLSDTTESYVSNALMASLDSPEIWNAIATYLIDTSRPHLSPERLRSIKILYDIAIGLAHGQEYYLPKYEFNRVRCDFLEIEAAGPPRNHGDVETLVSTLDSLHKLGPRFPWARRFLQKEVCQYLCQYQNDPLVRQLLNHEHFDRYWVTLRTAFRKKLHRV